MLAEVAWVLRIAYKFNRATAAASLRRLIDTEGVQVEGEATTRLALAAFQTGSADFFDGFVSSS